LAVPVFFFFKAITEKRYVAEVAAMRAGQDGSWAGQSEVCRRKPQSRPSKSLRKIIRVRKRRRRANSQRALRGYKKKQDSLLVAQAIPENDGSSGVPYGLNFHLHLLFLVLLLVLILAERVEEGYSAFNYWRWRVVGIVVVVVVVGGGGRT
jgi:hypothetical protein